MFQKPASPEAATQEKRDAQSHVKHGPAMTKVVRVGSITIATGMVAGARYVIMPSTALACPSPPCGAPGSVPP
jgi:hypothetical protein